MTPGVNTTGRLDRASARISERSPPMPPDLPVRSEEGQPEIDVRQLATRHARQAVARRAGNQIDWAVCRQTLDERRPDRERVAGWQ